MLGNEGGFCFFERMKIKILFLLLTSLGLLYGQAQPIQLDGRFEDWQTINPIADPTGDQQVLDLLELRLAHDAEFLYVFLRFKETIPFQESAVQLWMDTDNDASTGQALHGMGADFRYDFGQKNGLLDGQPIGQADIGLISLPTHTSPAFELILRRSGTFSDTTFRLFVQADGNGDKVPDQGSLSYTFSSPVSYDPYTPVSLDRHPESHFRLASYNVRFDSPFDPGLNAGFRRVMQAVDADIICFNEFFSSTASQVRAWLQATLPGTWYVSKEDAGNVTLSRWPIVQSEQVLGGSRMTANLIDLPDSLGTDLLVINCHLRCCGANAERQREADALVAYLRDARNDGSLAPDIPAVLAGDFNLVGDVQQLTTLLTGDIQNEGSFGVDAAPDGDGTDLKDLAPLQADRPRAVTWRNPGSAFAPGKLDYIIFSDSRLEAEQAFILDSRAMPSARLSQYRLQAADTEGSDHLPLVADFSLSQLSPQNLANRPTNDLIQVFPQPTQGELWVKWRGNQSGSWRLLSMEGKVLQQDAFVGTEKLQLDVGYFPPGCYLLKVSVRDAVFFQKIMIQ
jgi:endonuclease/exonuclease/phosphatase family metal-dependent hydrolase